MNSHSLTLHLVEDLASVSGVPSVFQRGLQPLSFELSAYEPSPQIPHTQLLTGVLWPVGRIFIRNPITLLRRVFMNSDPGKYPWRSLRLKGHSIAWKRAVRQHQYV